jgi:magnesium-transporting ATPase (P-type)
LPGVTRVEAGPRTRNVLLIFDPQATDQRTLLAGLTALRFDTLSDLRDRATVRPAPLAQPVRPVRPARQVVSSTASSGRPIVVAPGTGQGGRAHIPVRGLDRSPHLWRRLVHELQRLPGVRARVRAHTGHVFVEYDEYRVVLDELLGVVAQLEMPIQPGEDRPAHPLDPAPLLAGLTRVIGGLVGLGVLTFRRLSAPQQVFADGLGLAATVAGVMNLFQGFPVVGDLLKRHLGQKLVETTSSLLGISALTIANFPIGLLLTLVEGLLLVEEVAARRAAWRRYEEQLDAAVVAEPGALIRLEGGTSVPWAAEIVEGTGTAVGDGGLPFAISPGSTVPAAVLLHGGPFAVEVLGHKAYEHPSRPAPVAPTTYDAYLRVMAPLSMAFAGLTALRTGSVFRAFEALLLLNPRTAVIGKESANLSGAARALRAGLTVVGTRPERGPQRPDVLLLDGTRLLTDGMEVAAVRPTLEGADPSAILDAAGAVSAAAGFPWGNVFPRLPSVRAAGGEFNGLWASAKLDGVGYTLGPPSDIDPDVFEWFQTNYLGGYLLELCQEDGPADGYVALRPRIAAGAEELIQTCHRFGVELALVPRGDAEGARAVCSRLGVAVLNTHDRVDVIRKHQHRGARVAFVSDSAEAGEPFAACDMAVGLAGGRRGHLPARADLLAPDLRAVADLLETGTCRDAAVQDGVGLSIVSNAIGVAVGLTQGRLGAERASLAVYLSAFSAIGVGWLRLRGGRRKESALAYLTDPKPERWGRREPEEVLRVFRTSADGLSIAEARTRLQPAAVAGQGSQLWAAVRNQLRTPIVSILAGGAGLTLVLGQPLNTALLGVSIGLNIAIGVWQEREIGRASDALKRLAAGTARVVRSGITVVVPDDEVVPGDVLVLTAGHRVPADARLLAASGLEVAEAALTGESLPVVKGPEEWIDSARVVLEGSDVLVGSGRAVVVAVGRQTRLGSTAAALSLDREEDSALGARLGQILHVALPVAFGGGVAAGLVGWLYGRQALGQLTLGVTTALSAVPEGLPLLAGVGQAGVASRLSARNALVRRVAAVEALGRVDVACTDKTGTLTEGRLAVRLVTGMDGEPSPGDGLTPEHRRVLLTAALASPHPDATEIAIHPTDRSVTRAACEAGFEDEIRVAREREVPFDSARAFHATVADGRLCIKGAVERLAPRCAWVRTAEGDRPLDENGRGAVLARATHLAENGLRILMVAEGQPTGSLDDPGGLTALGFVGISDPLRASVPSAVRRCLAAGVRVVMLTGDHPATARAIAREAGLLGEIDGDVVRAAELADLPIADLDHRLRTVTVIARATPLDKLRIVESLRRCGHAVAMTGDGVNDAPALRLADVGVAMGRTGTEVARQVADLVLTDDDFATLVESLVEGRGFWRNMRNALGLLLGGNAGELALVLGTSVLGLGSPLSTVQILLVNMISDALPCLAVVLQRPRHRNLAGLAREGLWAMDRALLRDILRRGLATVLPSLAGYLVTRATVGPVQASAVAFGSVVSTQLAQTLDVGRVEGTLSGAVVGAVLGSTGVLVSSLTVPPIRNFLGLVTPTPFSWTVIGAGTVAAVLVSRAVTALDEYLVPLIPPASPGDDPAPTNSPHSSPA